MMQASAGGVFFAGANPLMHTGVQRQLQIDDLLQVSASSHPTHCTDALWRAWQEVRSKLN